MKKILNSIILVLALTSCLVQPQSGQSGAVREKTDLSGFWSFKADPQNEGEGAGWYKPGTDKTYWPLVNVPIAFDNCGPGMDRYFGTAWFCKKVFVPESFEGQRIILHFEGINYNAKVWVNGQLAGENHDAFLPFDIVINEAVKTGAENNIAVSVNNIRGRGQFPLFEGWYGQGGFLREAFLVSTDHTYIANTNLVAAAGQEEQGHLSLTATVNNDSPKERDLKMQVRVLKKTGKELARFTSPAKSLDKNGSTELSIEGDLHAVKWWAPDTPVLYTVETSILEGDKIVDQLVRRTGFRTVEVKDSKILVNGEPVFLLGFNRHEDSPRTGMAVDLEQAEEDFRQMKKIGCNYVRFCHYPHHPGELDLCDELGLFVLAENAMNEWGHIDHPAPNPAIALEPEDAPLVIANAKRTLTKMVARDNHHPSIITWSVSNENEETLEEVSRGNDLLLQFGKILDSSRPWTHVSNSFKKEGWENFYHFDDVIVVNVYPTHWYEVTDQDIEAGLPESTKIMEDTLRAIHNKFPGKPIVVGEYGFPEGDGGEYAARKQAIALEAEFNGLKAPYVAGGALWCYARHPWPWYNVSSYGYVSRNRKALFPALTVVERLYREHKKSKAGMANPD